MKYEIRLTDDFKKRAAKFLRGHRDMYDRYEKTLKILGENPFHPSLRLHKLKGGLADYYSISINIEYRIIMEFAIIDNIITPIDIGAHDDVY